MISVRYNMVSGKTLTFVNVRSDISTLGEQCAQNTTIIMRGGDGKDVAILGRHVESIVEL